MASSLYTGTIIGNALDNVISGPTNVGPTIIDGGAGADTMIDRWVSGRPSTSTTALTGLSEVSAT